MAENSTRKCMESALESASTKMSEEEDSGITMLDVLEGEQELEEDAKAVLGGSDDKNCTYPQGYIKRQALYACETCNDPKSMDFQQAGICLACSYHCHEGHKLVELYTKREFCCDCGNKKFPKNPCNFEPNKIDYNDKNSYNQNFTGVYCICHRPYPDPEDETPDEMIQCVICEDWYHARHLGTVIPAESEYFEMTCGACVNKNRFLIRYLQHSVLINKKKSIEDDGLGNSNPACEFKTEEGKSGSSTCHYIKGCPLVGTIDDVNVPEGAVFWLDGWREQLCDCAKCKIMYHEIKVLFLIDEEDPVIVYQETGKGSASSQYEEGMKALSNMERVQQVEAIHSYNDMTSELKKYLKKFAVSKKVVREEDIREFFSGMEARKRQKVNSSFQFSCR